MKIERLVPDDQGHATALVNLLDDYARDPMGGGRALSDETRSQLGTRLALRSDYIGFLALVDDEPVGLINCFEGFSTFAARPLLNIHDLTVRTPYRRKGIGSALLRAAEAAARERGCCKLTLEVLSNNAEAVAAYTRADFAAYQLDPAAGQALFMQKWLRTPC